MFTTLASTYAIQWLRIKDSEPLILAKAGFKWPDRPPLISFFSLWHSYRSCWPLNFNEARIRCIFVMNSWMSIPLDISGQRIVPQYRLTGLSRTIFLSTATNLSTCMIVLRRGGLRWFLGQVTVESYAVVRAGSPTQF
jgi:hypothetical protein